MTAPSFLQRHLGLLQRSVGHRWSRSGAASRAPVAGRAPPATRRPRHPPAVGASGTDGLDPERRVRLLQRHVGLDLLQRSARRAPLLRWVKLLHQLARQAPLQRPAHRAPPARGSDSSLAARRPQPAPSPPLMTSVVGRSTWSGSGGTPSGGSGGCRPSPSPSEHGGVDRGRAWLSADRASEHFFSFLFKKWNIPSARADRRKLPIFHRRRRKLLNFHRFSFDES
jgi:hypothetical protein